MEVKKTKRYFNPQINSLFYFILILVSCNLAPTGNKEQPGSDGKIKAKKEYRFNRYCQDNSIEIVRFGHAKNQPTLDMIFNSKVNFDNYFFDLETIFFEAKADNIVLDSIKRISMNFFSFFDEVAIEFSSIEEIQEELINQIKENRPFLNHKLIGENLQQSKNINRIIKLLGRDSKRIKNIIVEKCRSELLTTKNSDNGIKYKLHCAHLYIYLK